MPGHPLHHLITLGHTAARGLRQRLLAATRPAVAPLVVGTLADLARSKPALVAENALLRHQVAIRLRQHPDEATMRDSYCPTKAILWRLSCRFPVRMPCLATGIPTLAPTPRELPSRILSSDTSLPHTCGRTRRAPPGAPPSVLMSWPFTKLDSSEASQRIA